MSNKYREAAHAAARAVEDQGALLPCVVPANNIVYEFLLEARKVLQRSCEESGRESHLPNVMKKAAQEVQRWSMRIYDAASAQEVNYIGANIAKMIEQHLFSLYPPEPLSWEEQEERREQKRALKEQEKAKKRKATAPAAPGSAAAAGPPLLPLPGGDAADAELDAAGGGPRKRSKGAKPPAEYIPRIGSANYAFLIVLLEAIKGPAKKEFLIKHELMERAEASGLANKSIYGEGNPAAAARGGNPTQYYNGWSCFNSQLVNQHQLAHTWSNPKKCSLLPKGLDLAERLYRDAVRRGKLAPIPGIPTEGDFLFQLAAPEVPEAGGASRWEVPAAPPPPAATAAAVRPAPARRQSTGGRAAQPPPAAGPLLSPPGCTGAGAYPAPHALVGPGSVQRGTSGGYGAAAVAPWPGPQTGAAAIAAALAAAGLVPPPRPPPEGAYYTTHTAAAEPRRAVAAAYAGAAAVNRVAAYSNHAPSGGPGRPGSSGGTTAAGVTGGSGGGGSDPEVIDLLLDDDDDPPPLAARLAAAMGAGRGAAGAAAPRAAAGANQDLGAAAALAVGAGWGAGALGDADVAAFVEMGYSDKKACKALRRSSNVEEALDLIEHLNSESESDSGDDAFHDAQEALPGGGAGEPLPSPPPLGPHPGHFIGRRPSPSKVRPGYVAGSQQGSQPQPPQQQQQVQRVQQARPYQEPPDLLCGGTQGSAAVGAPRGAGHLRQGTQQGGGGRVRLGSQQSAGAGGWPPSQPQPEGEGLSTAELLRGAGLAPPAAAPAAAGPSGLGVAQGSTVAGGGGGSRASSNGIRQGPEQVRLPPITPGRCFGDEYEVVFLVDGREQFSRYSHQGRSAALADHLDQMRRTGLRVEQRQLKIGDAVWVARSRAAPAREYVLDFIVERKSIDDLLNSIRSSGRYEKQKFWLRKCGLRHVNYLIEGDPDMLPGSVEQKTVKTASASIEVMDKFRVLRTKGHFETFKLYQALTRSIEGMYGPLRPAAAPAAGAGAQARSFAEWDAHMSRIQRDNTTLHDVWALMLTGVHGLGTETVQTILQHYPTPLSLYRKYRQVITEAALQRRDPTTAACGVLLGLRRENCGRAIGQDKAARVYQSLFARGWDPTRG